MTNDENEQTEKKITNIGDILGMTTEQMHAIAKPLFEKMQADDSNMLDVFNLALEGIHRKTTEEVFYAGYSFGRIVAQNEMLPIGKLLAELARRT